MVVFCQVIIARLLPTRQTYCEIDSGKKIWYDEDAPTGEVNLVEAFRELDIYVAGSVVDLIVDRGRRNSCEQAWLIGSSSFLNQIDCVASVAGTSDSDQFIPDMDMVNDIIAQWREAGICFCGFIHSHPMGPGFLSGSDIRAMEAWVTAVRYPFMNFGLVDADGQLKMYLAYGEECGHIRVNELIPIGDNTNKEYLKWRNRYD